MDDERVVGAELQRLAATDPLDPIDPHAMLTRGRRSRRTHRLLAGGGGVAAVAAIAVGASLLPNAVAPDREVAGPTTATSSKLVAADFSPVPGVPRGEAGVTGQLTQAEADRRCGLRYPGLKPPLKVVADRQAGLTAKFQSGADCVIPGGDKPSAALVAETLRDPVPTMPEAQLRACSVQFWTDLTTWRVVASDAAPGFASSVVAVSPSGQSVVKCMLVLPKSGPVQLDPKSQIQRMPVGLDNFTRVSMFAGRGERCPAGGECGWLYVMVGRVRPDLVRIEIEHTGGVRHEVAIKDGWYAVAWMGTKHSPLGTEMRAYAKNGRSEGWVS